MPRTLRLLACAALAAFVAMTVVGCGKREKAPALEPKVSPPVIGEAGVLRAGVDLDYPPFGATAEGERLGLDVDVAAALAERLGLKLEIVSVPATQAPAALADGSVDVALGALPLSEELLTQVAFAGSYANDGPAFFASTDATVTLAGLGKRRPAVQRSSAAQWAIERDMGSEVASGYPTLRAAFEALNAGQAEVVAGDAVVGAYIAREFGDIRFAGQIGPAVPLGVAVAKDASELEAKVRGALDGLSADGTLGAIRSKWVGDLPELEVSDAEGT